jgi:tRNA G10  N-methylase Trm11
VLFYAPFVSGMQKVAETIVRDRLPDVTIQKLLDGAIVFETQCGYDKLNFFCFNNIFAVISIIERPYPDTALESHMKALCRSGTNTVISENNKKIRSFRVITSFENRLVPVNEKVRKDTERYIAEQSGMEVDRTKPDTEVWFLYRNEGFSVCMKRLTKHASFEKSLHPGELIPQLAYMLCRLSRPRPGETVLDPFCGYGSIPEQRLKHFPQAHVYASDIDDTALAFSRNKITGTLRESAHFRKADIYDLPSFIPKESVDAIITDPPWGMYDRITIGQFYEDMIGIFAELLKGGGVAVVLTAKKDELIAGVEKSVKFEIAETMSILVSGRKAGVFVLKKREAVV